MRRTRTGYMAQCPTHDDSDPSLSVSEGEGGKALAYCHASPDCTFDAISAALGFHSNGNPWVVSAFRTSTGAEIGERYQDLGQFTLDVEGAAEAFAYLHGHGGNYNAYREYPAFAWDPNEATWREWKMMCMDGWQPRRSILPEMTTVVGALCALDAYRTTDNENDAERKYRALRQRHLGVTVDKAIRLATVLLTVERWNIHNDVWGLPAGEMLTIALGDRRPTAHEDQRPEDYVTRSMAAPPIGKSDLWQRFLHDLTGGDGEMEDALQVHTAAAMFPGNEHHKAHVLYGDGNTGKSTYLKTIQRALGDYAGSARASVFVSEKDNHPAELLPFIDKRIVVLPELPNGVFRSDLLKTVTGGDAISVRGMRQNPRTATPAATLFFSANELPSLRMVDNAIRRRLIIWSMGNQPPNVDLSLGATLASEDHIGAVVRWLQAGLDRYAFLVQADQPLPMPDAVAQATADYFTEVDTVGQWADACIVEGGETAASTLYKSYLGWCESAKRRPLSERAFTLWIGRHYTRRRTREGSTYPVTVNG